MKGPIQDKEQLVTIDWIRQKQRAKFLKGKVVRDKGHNHTLNDFF